MPDAYDGHGSSISFASSGFNMNLIAIDGPNSERASIDTTHMGTSEAHTSKPANLYDPGTLDITVEFDPSIAVPINGAIEAITVTWPDANTDGADGYFTNFTRGAAIGERMEGTGTIKLSGPLS